MYLYGTDLLRSCKIGSLDIWSPRNEDVQPTAVGEGRVGIVIAHHILGCGEWNFWRCTSVSGVFLGGIHKSDPWTLCLRVAWKEVVGGGFAN